MQHDVFNGRLAQWKVKGFVPRRLGTDPGPAIRTVRANTGPVSAQLVSALTYNLRFASCAAFLDEILASNWLARVLKGRVRDDVLEACLLLAECRPETTVPVLWHELAGRVPEKYAHAFDRVMQTAPHKLDLESKLVQLGFDEIEESVDRLATRQEVEFYMRLLSRPQFTELQRELQREFGLVLSRAAVVQWAVPRELPSVPGPGPVLPGDPPRFCNGKSFVQWHCDYLVAHGHADEMQGWLDVLPASDSLTQLYNAIDTMRTIDAPSDNCGRTLVVLPGPAEPAFYTLFKGTYCASAAVAETLKAEAATTNPVFGQSVRAASVAFREARNAENHALCMRLEPLDVLQRPTQYMIDYGADLVVLGVDAATFSAVRTQTAAFGLVVWPRDLANDVPSRIRLMQVLARNGFDRWGTPAQPLVLPPSMDAPDKAVVVVNAAHARARAHS